MKMKKVLSVLLSTAMAVSLAAGCGNSDKEEGSSADSSKGAGASDISGEVTFVSGNDQTGALDEMIAAFNEEYPNVTIDHQLLPGNSDDVKKSLMTSLAAGDSEPDVFECDIIWVSQFAAAGWLLDVTDNLEAKADEYLAGPLSTCYFGDKAYAYPNYTDVGLLYYRSDLVDTPPATWDELVEMSKEHIGKDGIDYGYIFQMFQGEPTSCNMLEFIKQNGGTDLVDGKFAMNNSNTIESLEFVNSLIDDGISPEGVLSHKPDDSRAIFEEGKALFMRNWTYAYANANADTSKVKGNVGVTALPVGPSGTESSGTLGGWNFAINANTENEAASVAFAEFMSSYDAQKISTMVRSTFPTAAKVYEDEDVLTDKPYLADVRSAADNAKPRPQVRDYSAISSVFQVYFHKALTKELGYEDAMEQMDTELNAALEKMK
ncbi:MAG: extracellular solute-binding protein [Ruminococcus sp.]|nr:extracellular solute-binding protein [Ruminococcus sp.]